MCLCDYCTPLHQPFLLLAWHHASDQVCISSSLHSEAVCSCWSSHQEAAQPSQVQMRLQGEYALYARHLASAGKGMLL